MDFPKEYRAPALSSLASQSQVAWGACESGSAAEGACWVGTAATGGCAANGISAGGDCFYYGGSASTYTP